MKALTSLVFLLAALPVAAQTMDHSSVGSASVAPNGRLGTVSFPVSCATPSQAPFNRGVALLHDFWYEEYEEARAQFDRLAKSDPGCAMAHWGVAMSIFHEIWDRPDADSMQLGWAEMQKAQSLTVGTEREQAYIAALADYYWTSLSSARLK
jgi:hypothetical protein